MAVSCDARFATPTGPRRADELAASAPHRGWQRLSCGPGSKGHRLYDWLLVDLGADEHLLLVRRSITKPSELAYYIGYNRTPVPLAELVRVVGSQWSVEETFQFAKNDTGLDHYQVRRYDAWYRHITLSMLAAAFLAVTAHTEQSDGPASRTRQGVVGAIVSTVVSVVTLPFRVLAQRFGRSRRRRL